MRRTVPSFAVEVRRRPRLAVTSKPNVQSLETKPPPAAFDRESAAAIGTKKADKSSVDVSAPKGRILPTLVAGEPPGRLLRDAPLSATESEPTSRAPKRPSVRPIKGRAHTFRPPRNSESSSAESAPLADMLSAASCQPSTARAGTGISPSDPTTEPSRLVGNSRGAALRAKEKREDKMPISHDEGRATPLLNDQRSAVGEGFLATPPSSLGEPSRRSRKRTILSRYVFDDELKPGERWKQRLLLTR